MSELVTIPISVFELAINYERPRFKLWLDRAVVVQSIYDALEPWKPRIDDVESLTTGKVSEQGFLIKLPIQRISFFFGPSSCKFTREDMEWQNVEETILILNVALSALIQSGGIVVQQKNATVSLHIQPKTVSFITLLKPFIAPRLAELDAEPVMTIAAVAKWADHKVTLDGSGRIANAIFLRFEREFSSITTNHELAERLRQDHEELFRILELEEDRR